MPLASDILTDPKVASLLPSVLAIVIFIIATIVGIVVAFWRAFKWLIGQIKDVVREAIRSEEMRKIVKHEVDSAFAGAVTPFMSANANAVSEARDASKTGKKAHERVDVIEKRVGAIETRVDVLEARVAR